MEPHTPRREALQSDTAESGRRPRAVAPAQPGVPPASVAAEPPAVGRSDRPAGGACTVSDHAPGVTPAGRKHRTGCWRRRAIWTAVGLAVLATLGLVVGQRLAQTAPAWWRSVPTGSPESKQAARNFQNALVAEVTRLRPATEPGPVGPRSDAWSLAIAPAGANAWLNEAFPRWVTGSDDGFAAWAHLFDELQIAFRDDRLHIGAKVFGEQGPRVYNAAFRPRLDPEGSLWFEADTVGVGRLQIPAFAARSRAEQLAESVGRGQISRAQLETFRAMLTGDTPVLIEPLIDLGDGRIVRLVGLHIDDSRLIVTFRTELPQRDELAGRTGAEAVLGP